jgi:diadenosine tetraphosphate (Ap4A) HIT family hydrolase
MFQLDERLQNDTVELGSIGINKILLANDSQYPWIILVPQIENVSELYHLNAEQQQETLQTISFIGQKMEEHFKADKMNIANIGNIVKQLHIHIVARFEKDLAWPAPIWGKAPMKRYEKSELEELCSTLQSVLNLK